MGKSVLLVYAHQEVTSFNSALLESAKKALQRCGHNVQVSDLYKMNFNPVISRSDILGPLKNEGQFNYSEEAGAAWCEGRIADDIMAEQAKVTAADLIIFQFPLHWMGMPAILKGWCDRVFLPNYAFTDQEVYDKGKMKGKRALLSLTTGAPEQFYTSNGPNGDINILLWPLQNGILRLTGFDVLSPQISFSPQMLSDDDRGELLRSWEARMTTVFEEKPIYFVPISKFHMVDPTDPLKGMELNDDVVKTEEMYSDCGLTIGQHLNRKLPPFSMLQPRSINPTNKSSKY